jgi:hypothetical protein
MAETKKKVAKKSKNEQVDSIIIILIVIILLAVIAGGIVFWIQSKTPDVQPLDTKPGLVTTDKGTYQEYLNETKKEVGSKTIPLKAQTESQVINYISAVLGEDDTLYFVSTDDTKNTVEIPGSNLKGIKYTGAEFVDVFDVKTTAKNYLIGLTDDGILISFDLTDIANEPETFKGAEAIEVYTSNDQVAVKCFDKTTKIIIG